MMILENIIFLKIYAQLIFLYKILLKIHIIITKYTSLGRQT